MSSIRFKLWVSYVLVIVIPLILLVAFLHILYHIFVGQVDAVKSHFNLQQSSVEELLHEELIWFAQLQTIVRENPDQLLMSGVLEDYDVKLSARKTSLVLLKDERLQYASAPIDVPMSNPFPIYELKRGEHYRYQQDSLQLDGKWMLGLQFAFQFSDGSDGHLFLIVDTSPVNKLLSRMLPSLAIAFLLAFIIVNALLTYWMGRQLIRPLKQLELAAHAMKEGDLEHAIDIHSNDELGQVAQAFEEMRKKLKESVEEKLKYEENRKQLIASISHDLKTPITTIKGYVEGILDGVADHPEKLEKYARTVHEKVNDMDRLIDELFLYSKLDMNSIPFHFKPLDLAAYICELLEYVKFDLEEEGICVNYVGPEKGSVIVMADAERLKRVFMNIIENSVKFMDKNDKRITIRIMPSEGSGEETRIEIEDNGSGIDERDLDRLFERFYRAEPSRHKDYGGSGLGLAIAKQMIEAHGGMIGAKSELKKGTMIYFTLKNAELQQR